MTKRKARYILPVATIVAFLAFGFSFQQIFTILNENKRATDSYASIFSQTVILQGDGLLVVDHAALLETNKYYAGWIDIPGTGISYPMMQYTDNDTYLRRSFDGEPLRAGCIFLDYRSDAYLAGANTVIYGHHAKDGTMFAALEDYMNADYAEKNNRIIIYIPDGNTLVYEVFAVYETNTGADCFTFDFATDQQRGDWVASMEAHSIYSFGIPVLGDDRIITLVTCTNRQTYGRYVVQAVLVEEKDNE